MFDEQHGASRPKRYWANSGEHTTYLLVSVNTVFMVFTMPSGLDILTNKRWKVDAYAANLVKRNVSNLLGVNLIARF